jgi:hypothetical protein
MSVTRHWLAPRNDGSWDVIDSEAVAQAYINEGRVKVEGPFVPADDAGAVADRDALATMLKRLLDVALVDGYGETVRDEAEALLTATGGSRPSTPPK